MAHSVRPNDGTRPSDPKDLIFQKDPEEPESPIPAETQQQETWDIPTGFLSAGIGWLCVMLYQRISHLNSVWHIFPTVSAWIYYVILGITFLASSALAYRLIRPRA